MEKIPLSEFDELLYAATFLKYYWTVYQGMNTAESLNYEHSDFIHDFIENDRLSTYSNVKRTPFNKIIITEEQLHYLKTCVCLTNKLKDLIWNNK